MNNSRTPMLIVIGLLAVVCVGAIAAYINERNKSHSVEISVGERGLRIDGK